MHSVFADQWRAFCFYGFSKTERSKMSERLQSLEFQEFVKVSKNLESGYSNLSKCFETAGKNLPTEN